MQKKIIRAKKKEDAIKLAKNTLGDNIVILDSKMVENEKNPNEKLFEVTIGQPENSSAVEKLQRTIQTYNKSGKPKSFDKVLNETKNAIPNNQDMALTHKLTDDIKILRDELNEMNKRFRRIALPDFPDNFSTVHEKLRSLGFTIEHSESLIRKSYIKLADKKNVSEDEILDIVKKDISTLCKEVKIKKKKQRLIMFLGGTGCGKTSMILKMAASEKFYGKNNVGIISTDSFKSGGFYPIESFSKISGIESRLAETVGRLPIILDDFSDKDVVLVDTPGRGMNFKNKVSELQKIIDMLKPDEKILVLPANQDIDDLFFQSVITRLHGVTSLCITKLDETVKPGKIASVMNEIDVPISALSNGQGIPKDIMIGNSQNVIKSIFDNQS